MNKSVRLLLIGFIIFIFGILLFNVEISKFLYNDYLPSEFGDNLSKIEVEIDPSKEYEVKKAKFNDNIVIEKVIDDSLDNKIIIESSYKDTSLVRYYINSDNDDVEIVLENNLRLTKKGVKNIYNLVIKSIAEKRIYNYKQIKYSKVSIIGNSSVLSRIEID